MPDFTNIDSSSVKFACIKSLKAKISDGNSIPNFTSLLYFKSNSSMYSTTVSVLLLYFSKSSYFSKASERLSDFRTSSKTLISKSKPVSL